MKDAISIVLLIVIVSLTIWNVWADKEGMHDHYDFFQDVRAFMNKGDRNTNEMGYKLCQRLNRIEISHKIKPTNCEKAYNLNGEVAP